MLREKRDSIREGNKMNNQMNNQMNNDHIKEQPKKDGEGLRYKAETTTLVNCRERAGLDGKKRSYSPLKRGTEVEVIGTEKADDGSKWAKILYNNETSYVGFDYVKKK